MKTSCYKQPETGENTRNRPLTIGSTQDGNPRLPQCLPQPVPAWRGRGNRADGSGLAQGRGQDQNPDSVLFLGFTHRWMGSKSGCNEGDSMEKGSPCNRRQKALTIEEKQLNWTLSKFLERDWEKIFAKQRPEKGSVSRMYKEL